MSARCLSAISWLRLERYHLGELAEGARVEVEAHLATCATCAACYARIRADDARALPPGLALEVPHEAPAKAPLATRRTRRRAVALAAPLAMAAGVALFMGRVIHNGETATAPGAARAKGGDVTFTLVKEDGTRIVDDEGTFHDRDRLKALATCPPSFARSIAFDLVVFDAEGTSFPLAPATGFACGNEVPLAGALRLVGHGEETVCLVWAEGGEVERRFASREALPRERSLCKRLRPAVAP